jgi:RND family efflux transporter MFP subunit
MAEKTNDMNQKLLKQNFISQNASDNAESSLEVAKGNVQAAQAQLRVAQNAVRDSVATSPLSGVVAKRHVQPGEKVAFDTPLVTVVDLKDMELQALVPSGDIPELKPGMTVDLIVDGFATASSRSHPAHQSVDGGRHARHSGVRRHPQRGPGTTRWHVCHRPHRVDRQPAVATLPSTAVRTEAGVSYVWTIVDGKLAKRTVVIGRRDDDAGRVEVKSELPAGVPVLSAKFDNLKEGAPALVRAADATPKKAS